MVAMEMVVTLVVMVVVGVWRWCCFGDNACFVVVALVVVVKVVKVGMVDVRGVVMVVMVFVVL